MKFWLELPRSDIVIAMPSLWLVKLELIRSDVNEPLRSFFLVWFQMLFSIDVTIIAWRSNQSSSLLSMKISKTQISAALDIQNSHQWMAIWVWYLFWNITNWAETCFALVMFELMVSIFEGFFNSRWRNCCSWNIIIVVVFVV